MCRRTLPLNSLRAFEVAARHKSLAKAAEELSVTPGAVHHQVKSLEMLLGVTLFNRAGNNLTLTKAATAALPTLESAFDLLSLATEKIRQHTSNGTLSLAVCPSFAQKWLIPRIDRFRQNFDRIELHISTTTEFPDLNNSEADIAIGYGAEERFRYPGVLAEKLMGDDVFPVCTPRYRDDHRLRSESDLLDAVLLHDDGALIDQGADWNSWLTAVNVHGDKEPAGIRFDTIALAIDAALLGQGVALGRRSLVADDLAAGRLIQPFARSLTVNGGYFIGNLKVIAEQPRVIAFQEWIFSEVSLGKALAPRLAAMAG